MEVKALNPTTQRTIRVPLQNPEDDVRAELRAYARKCAQYGNASLSESYAKAKGLDVKWTTYTDFNEELSAAVRDAVGRECVGIWRRLGKKILKGEQTLARFSNDRALVVRDRGVQLTKHGDGYMITVRCGPKASSDPIELHVWAPALKKDWYLADTLATIEKGLHRLTKATIQFDRKDFKWFVRISYEKTLTERNPAEVQAQFAWDGEVESYIVACDGRQFHVTDRIHRIREMKRHFEGIRYRLYRSLGKSRRWHEYRRALVKAGTFERWSEGPLHQLSREIVNWCAKQGAGSLLWLVADEDFPWAKLREQCKYKGAEVGLIITQPEPEKEQKEGLRKKGKKKAAKAESQQQVAEQLQSATL